MRRGLNLYGRGLVVVMSLLTRSDISYEADIYTRGRTKLMSHINFSETITTVVIKFTFNVGTSFSRLWLFFYQVFFIINTLFRPLLETLYTGPVKLFPEAPELFTHARWILARRQPKNGVLGVHTSQGQEDGSQRFLNKDCRKDDWNHRPLWPKTSNALCLLFFLILYISLWTVCGTSLQKFH